MPRQGRRRVIPPTGPSPQRRGAPPRRGVRPGGRGGLHPPPFSPANAEAGLPTLHSTYLLFDAATGAPLAFIDGDEITARPPAAAAAPSPPSPARRRPPPPRPRGARAPPPRPRRRRDHGPPHRGCVGACRLVPGAARRKA